MILDLFTKPSPSVSPGPQNFLSGICSSVQQNPPATIRDLLTAAKLKQALVDGATAPSAAIVGAKAFVSGLPQMLPEPSSIEVADDGEITLEWYRNPRCVLLVNVGESPTISFAALNGTHRVHGKAMPGDRSADPILDFLRNLQRSA